MPVGMPICMAIGCGLCGAAIAAMQLGGGVPGGRKIDGRVGLEEADRLEAKSDDLHRHHGKVLWTRNVGSSKAVPQHWVLANQWAVLQAFSSLVRSQTTLLCSAAC